MTRQPRASKSLATLRLGSIVLPLLGSLIWGVVTYQDERRRAFDQAEENVALVRQYAERLVQTQTIMQQAAAAYAAGSEDPGYLRSEAFHRFLAEVERAQPFTHGLAVIALDGRVQASSRSWPVDVSFGQRDYLAAIAAGEQLVLERLILKPTGQDALVVVQPFRHGDFQGAITSAVAVEAIRDFLRGVAARPGESASLLREDGLLLVRHVPTVPTMLDVMSPARKAIEQGSSGRYQATAVSDGVVRLYAFSKMGDLPFYANFGVPLSLVRRTWLLRTLPVWLLLVAGGLFSFVLSGLAQRSVHQRLAHEEQARLREAAEARAAQQQQFMRELNHRVKNNLAMIDSLIAIQLRKTGQLDARELRARITAIADVHDLLYRAANSHELDLGELLTKVCRSPALVPAERGISLDLQIVPGITISASRATPLALAVVELMTNAVKYAFPDRPGTISLGLRRAGDGTTELTVADDGIGISEAATRASGIRIVEALIMQIDGSITREDGPGTRYLITVPMEG